MVKTIDDLFMDNISIPVIADYFGLKNRDHFDIIAGIYVGLFKMGIPKSIVENCAKTNRLDELIHKIYRDHMTGYYKLFIEKNIKIGETLMYCSKEKEMEIYSIGSQCPNCGDKNYKQNKVNGPPDCFICYIFVCKLCSVLEDGDYICKKCLKSK